MKIRNPKKKETRAKRLNATRSLLRKPKATTST